MAILINLNSLSLISLGVYEELGKGLAKLTHLIVQLRYLPEDCLIILNLFWSSKIEMNISGEKEKKIGIVDMCKYK